MNRRLPASIVLRLGAAVLLLWALSPHSIGYYSVLRWVTCGVGCYLTTIAVDQKKLYWIWVFGAIAILFNPLIPIHFDKHSWRILDVITGVVFLASIMYCREDHLKTVGGGRL